VTAGTDATVPNRNKYPQAIAIEGLAPKAGRNMCPPAADSKSCVGLEMVRVADAPLDALN